MKSVATFLLVLHAWCAYALPVGNPVEASLLRQTCRCWNIRVGFYGDYVFDRHLEVDRRETHASLHQTKLFTNAGYLALNFCNRLDVFATFGGTEIQLETRTQTDLNIPLWIETDTRFSWSVGARGTIWEWGCLGIGAEAQYFETRPYLNFIRAQVFSPVYVDGEHVRYKEWQIGLGGSYKIALNACSTFLVPYIAVKWGRALFLANHIQVTLPVFGPFILDNFEDEHGWGYALGLTLVGGNKGSVTVEGRFANEKAVYVNSQVRF